MRESFSEEHQSVFQLAGSAVNDSNFNDVAVQSNRAPIRRAGKPFCSATGAALSNLLGFVQSLLAL